MGTAPEQNEERHDPDYLNRRVATDLLNASVAYARVILRRYGEVAPFGFGMNRDGEISRETLDLPRLPRDPARLWKLMAEHLHQRARRGVLQAVALAANVALAAPSAEGYTDALVLSIERENGYAVEVTVPYKIYGGHFRNIFPRRVALGKAQMDGGVCRIFTGYGAVEF